MPCLVLTLWLFVSCCSVIHLWDLEHAQFEARATQGPRWSAMFCTRNVGTSGRPKWHLLRADANTDLSQQR